MAEFVYAKHADVEGLAYIARSALDRLEGWTEVEPVENDVEPKAKTAKATKSAD